jgi:hypothetical protein
VATLPLKKPASEWVKIRSEWTLDLMESKIADPQTGRVGEAGLARGGRSSTRRTSGSQRCMTSAIADDLGETDGVGDFEQVAERVRKLGGGGAGLCTTPFHSRSRSARRRSGRAGWRRNFVPEKVTATAAEDLRDPLPRYRISAPHVRSEQVW